MLKEKNLINTNAMFSVPESTAYNIGEGIIIIIIYYYYYFIILYL